MLGTLYANQSGEGWNIAPTGDGNPEQEVDRIILSLLLIDISSSRYNTVLFKVKYHLIRCNIYIFTRGTKNNIVIQQA